MLLTTGFVVDDVKHKKRPTMIFIVNYSTAIFLWLAIFGWFNCSFVCVTGAPNDVIVRKQSIQPCSICSRLGTDIIEENDISDLLPNVTCGVAEIMLSEINESDVWCMWNQNLLENKCCDQSSFVETYECASNIRSMIFNDDYDTYVAPVQTHTDKDNMRLLEIGANINFLAVKSLDVKTSTLELYLDVYLFWNDPRLKWDVNETNCAGVVNARASPSVEETELWVPTLDVQNRGSSLNDLTGPPALVLSDGSVLWQRTGPMTIICTFTGLRRMPFDDLGCNITFTDASITMTSLTEYEFLPSFGQNRSGLSLASLPINYAEFTIVKEDAKISFIESWWFKNQFTMSLTFRRATSHYILFTILPNILFSYLSCLQYALDVGQGERLSYSVTIVLITVTQSIVTASLLPVCREHLWLNMFNFFSMVFCVFGIVETCIIFILLGVVKKKGLKGTEEEENLVAGAQDEELVSMVAHDGRNADMSVNTQFDMNQNVETYHEEIQGKENKEATTETPETKPSKSRKESVLKKIDFRKMVTTKIKSAEDLMFRIDTGFLYVMPLIYSIFLIYMFASNRSWDDE